MRNAVLAPLAVLALSLVACPGAHPTDLFLEDASASGSTAGSTSGSSAGTGSTSGSTAGSSSGSTSGSSSGSTSGSTSGSSSGSSAGTTSGTTSDAGSRCSVDGPPCPTGQVCRATACTTGVCVTLAGDRDSYAPVCGCDGLTYWSGFLAGDRGVAVRGSGPCDSVRAIPCGGLSADKCPGGSRCNRQAPNAGSCATAVTGACWVLPAACTAGFGLGLKRRPCFGGQTCTLLCGFIDDEMPYWDDPTCKP